MSQHYDVIILGSGPAGFSCAMQTAKFERKALIVESNEEYLGGSWINTGTVPSKALRETASNIYKYSSLVGSRDGKKPYERFRMRDVLRYKDRVLATENSEIKDNLIKNKVSTVLGFGTIKDKNTVDVTRDDGSSETYTTDHILIATGARSLPPERFSVDHRTILDNRSILDLHYIPSRLVIVGASIQALEFATIFSALGTSVTILNSTDTYLSFLDTELKDEFNKILAGMRVSIFNQTNVLAIGPNPLRNCTEVTFEEPESGKRHVIETEQVLFFGNREPNSRHIGLQHAGVACDEQGYIITDRNYKTNVPGIYAAGDVIGYPGLASVSFSQGRTAACHMFGLSTLDTNHVVPYGIYSIPEIAGVGLTEDEAREQELDVLVGRAYYSHLTRANISRNAAGMLKLVFEAGTLRLLGVHIVGDNASDLVHIGQAVLHFGGTIRYFLDTVHNYPTYSQAYRIAAFNGINQVYKSGVAYSSILGETKP